MATINGFDVESGCIIDGHNGQYGPDRLADIAESWGWEPVDENDPRYWRTVAEARHDVLAADIDNGIDASASHNAEVDAWEQHHWTTELLEQWVNDNAVDVMFAWVDGEGFLIDPADTDWMDW